MTIFSGVNDQDRTPQSWPHDLAQNMSIEECTRIIDERFAKFVLNCPMPIRMKLDPADTIHHQGGCSLRVSPTDETQDRNIRGLRDRMAEVFQFCAAYHATYQFHITIAYPLAALHTAEDRVYQALTTDHVQKIAAAASVILLGLPEYCSFRNMYRYEVPRFLQT